MTAGLVLSGGQTRAARSSLGCAPAPEALPVMFMPANGTA